MFVCGLCLSFFTIHNKENCKQIHLLGGIKILYLNEYVTGFDAAMCFHPQRLIQRETCVLNNDEQVKWEQ